MVEKYAQLLVILAVLVPHASEAFQMNMALRPIASGSKPEMRDGGRRAFLSGLGGATIGALVFPSDGFATPVRAPLPRVGFIYSHELESANCLTFLIDHVFVQYPLA